jgi:hypothetical protein
MVDDITANEGLWNFKTQYSDKLERIQQQLPSTLVKTGKFLAMTHDQKMYQFLRDATQMSDLTARYILHKWNTENKNVSVKESLKDISESFINYDIPTHRFIQYGNDMGFILFSKFFLRIFKPMLKESVKHPLSVFALLMLQSFTGGLETIHKTSVLDTFNKLDTPLNTILDIVTANPFYVATMK